MRLVQRPCLTGALSAPALSIKSVCEGLDHLARP